ncbi:uncharacterized protein ARMOST_18424 [Armillaria ostoyae]|uniref:Uncharacterized protein n=1 Tax=Armillaria ostoyae TaxID=47428 RepID=A0A284S1S1_ARMOS|nr:uncharacterized protein ARMOST_18424 [Armillaria ostoyae]
MSTVSPSMAKKIRWCFFFSLAFVIVVPVLCIVLGKTLHPAEFAYIDLDSNDDVPRNQKIYLHADLTSADLKQGTMVIDWSILLDTCDSTSTNCTSVNIYFDANLLHSDTNSSEPSDNNRPTVPTFIWNVTADDQDYYLSNSPKFQTELFVFPQHKYGAIHEVRHTYSSDVYYPFDRYYAEVLAFAEDSITNESVPLVLDSTAGLVEGLKISADVANSSALAQEGLPQLIGIAITLQRGTLIKIYYITSCFPAKPGLITIMICLVMIMTVGFGFQQRNEIVVVPVGTVFAFTRLRLTMPGAPDGFGDILDFVGVLPCLVLLSISLSISQ